MAKPIEQDIIDKYSLADKTVAQMDAMLGPPGRRSKSLWSLIRSKKLMAEQKQERYDTFVKKVESYTADDLVELNGVIGFRRQDILEAGA